MQHLDELNFLIDAGKLVAGSDSKLARLIGVQPQRVSNWRTGIEACPPETQALIAEVAGFDPLQVLARATVQKFEGTPKGDRLQKVLGKATRAIGAALGIAGAAVLGIFFPSNDVRSQQLPQADQHNVYRGKKRFVKRMLSRRKGP